jgi:hypothetical protein
VKILFLCSSLALGVDGVGDYTRNLAGACSRLGHECLLVALNDRQVGAAKAVVEEPAAGVRIERLSTTVSWAERTASLSRLAAAFKPDRVSWQFVPYGYDPKGVVPLGALSAVARVLPVTGRHVFFHELWIGLSKGEGWKNRLVGELQRRRLLAWLRAWRPSSISTSNPVYQAVLKKEGYDARILPLFGNLPIVAGAATPKADELVVVSFGTLHPQWDPSPTAAFLVEVARINGRRLRLRIAGRAGGHVEAVRKCFCAQGIEPEILGSLTPAAASHVLQESHLGLAPHPWALIGKSGAALTMREHGLPVLVLRDDWMLRSGFTPSPIGDDPLLVRMGDYPAESVAELLARRTPPRARVDRIARSFLDGDLCLS